jgi:hypothetical protein
MPQLTPRMWPLSSAAAVNHVPVRSAVLVNLEQPIRSPLPFPSPPAPFPRPSPLPPPLPRPFLPLPYSG